MILPKYYKILGLNNKNPTDSELKKAYKKAALKYHPDRNTEDKETSEKKFKEISEAYSVLNDKNKKHIYDTYGEDGLKSGMANQDNSSNLSNIFGNGFPKSNGKTFYFSSNGGFDIDPHDIFSQLFANDDLDFGMHFNQSKRNPIHSHRGKNINNQKLHKINLDCTLEDLYNGKIKKLKLTCTDYTKNTSFQKILEIDVKAGWKSGTTVKYNGEGDILLNGNRQDLLFVIGEKKHKWYERDGDNLVYNVKLSPEKKNKNIKISLPLLNKTHISFETNITSDNMRKIIENKGMPIRKSQSVVGYGDLIININI
jgi:DnaJ family protein B protein 4